MYAFAQGGIFVVVEEL